MPTVYKIRRLLLPDIMALIDVVPQPSMSPRPPETPPSSPHLQACKQVHILNTGQFKKLLKAIQAIQTTPASEGKIVMPTKDVSSDKKQPVARASKLKFKKINKM